MMKGVAHISMDDFILQNDNENVNRYENILQGNPLNSLMNVSDRNLNIEIERTTGLIQIETKIATAKINGILIQIKNYDSLNINTTTFRFLDFILLKMCKHLPYNRKELIDDSKISTMKLIKISITNFMAICDLSNVARTKLQMQNSLEVLKNIKLLWYEKIFKKKKIEYLNFAMNIVNDFKSVRGGFIIQFDLNFLRYLSSYSYIMPFNMKLLQVDLNRYSNSYLIARKILTHLNMNQRKSNQNIISVKSLLEVCDIPTHSEILNSNNRGVKRLIITPFEKAMNHLKDINFLNDWNYQNDISDFTNWLKSNVLFIIKNYPFKVIP